MIVCSCNVFSDSQVRAAIADSIKRPQMSKVYSSLGCAAQCGRCAHTIKAILDQNEYPCTASCGATGRRH